MDSAQEQALVEMIKCIGISIYTLKSELQIYLEFC